MCQHTCIESELTSVKKLNTLWINCTVSFALSLSLNIILIFLSVLILLLNSEGFFVVYMYCLFIVNLLSYAQMPSIIHNCRKKSSLRFLCMKRSVGNVHASITTCNTLEYHANAFPKTKKKKKKRGNTIKLGHFSPKSYTLKCPFLCLRPHSSHCC